LGRLGLFLDAERVVEFVEETAERDAQREFDNLRLAEIFPEPSEQRVGNAMRMFPGGDRILDRKLVPLVEFWVVAAVIEDMVGPGGRNTLYHQKRRVVRHAIVAGIQLRDRNDRQLENALW
jgi:hypothetical protein